MTTCTTGSARPLLAGTTPSFGAAVNDDTSTVGARFQWWSQGVQVGEITTATTSASGSVVRATIPGDQELTEGTTYFWRAFGITADGGVSAAPTGWCEFTADTTGATTSLVQSTSDTCATGTGRPPVNTTTPKLSASYGGIDSPSANVTFEWWPLTGSAPLGTATSSAPVDGTASSVVPTGQMTTANAYKWRVKASDGVRVSPWSSWCEFAVDTTAPSVTSGVYPGNATSGSPGLSGTFTFSPAGMAGVTSYRYALDINPPTTVVNAASTGAQAQVSLAPATAGKHTLYVQSVDSTGGMSGTSAYPIVVADSDLTTAQSNEMRAQERFVQAADTISTAVDTGNPTGFTSIEIGDQAVILWWKGTVPADIQQSIDQARAIAPVLVNQATYSRAELESKADGLDQMMGSSGIPIEVVTADATDALAGPSSRTNDGWNGAKYSSFAGGGTIISGTSKCTAGFGVTNGSEEFLLTAAHRVYPGQTLKNGNGSRTIGKVSNEKALYDLALIRTDANRFMWDGGADGPKSFTKTVTGWKKAYPGQVVCQSGATTGTHCGWKNTRDLSYRYCDTEPYLNKRECYDDLIVASSTTLQAKAGDSGGPIFATDGGPTVQAVGIVSGGGVDKNNKKFLFYQDFFTANRYWNIRPIT
ncbi:trypsin-like serine protease [Actinoplanes sp. N902-109]|uniref:trypsin-like serine protease n=1 Tax=Actinoplanes sp. (strain N902-109) TaxID=649831 RepID=UPI0003295F87|nr:trypsin-like serine protease [Actinoplanes sp. N902-109]AGL16158.1 YD repeat-containing protein [Actinoplanes sp. N902-109]